MEDSVQTLTPTKQPVSKPKSNSNNEKDSMTLDTASTTAADNTDAASTRSRRSWFKRKSKEPRERSRNGSDKAVTIASSSSTEISRRSDEDDIVSPLEMTVKDDEWRLGDDIRMQLDL